MTATVTVDWLDLNQQHLTAAIANIRALLEAHAARGSDTAKPARPDGVSVARIDAIAAAMPAPPALERLRTMFRLSAFERSALLLCAAMEFDATIAPLCAIAHGDPQRAYPTFSLALALLPQAHWSPLAPSAPLRRWRLIEVRNRP